MRAALLVIALVLFAGVPAAVSDACTSDPVVGPCRGHLPRYYYSPPDQTCVLFYYGGCDGNANNYESKDECMNRCSGQ